jgi:hypothetical protein
MSAQYCSRYWDRSKQHFYRVARVDASVEQNWADGCDGDAFEALKQFRFSARRAGDVAEPSNLGRAREGDRVDSAGSHFGDDSKRRSHASTGAGSGASPNREEVIGGDPSVLRRRFAAQRPMTSATHEARP